MIVRYSSNNINEIIRAALNPLSFSTKWFRTHQKHQKHQKHKSATKQKYKTLQANKNKNI